MSELTAEQVARQWIELYNDGTPDSYGSDRFLELYAEDVDWREMPTAWHPEGRGGDRASVRKATQEGRSILRNRKAHLHEVVAEGDRAVIRYLWEATVGVDGVPIPRGTVIRAESASFITVTNGKIARAYDYSNELPPA